MRFKNLWKLYEYINKIPYNDSFAIAENMGWSREKTNKYLDRLIEHGIVKYKYYDGDESKSGFYPTPVKELINWEEFGKEEF